MHTFKIPEVHNLFPNKQKRYASAPSCDSRALVVAAPHPVRPFFSRTPRSSPVGSENICEPTTAERRKYTRKQQTQERDNGKAVRSASGLPILPTWPHVGQATRGMPFAPSASPGMHSPFQRSNAHRLHCPSTKNTCAI